MSSQIVIIFELLRMISYPRLYSFYDMTA